MIVFFTTYKDGQPIQGEVVDLGRCYVSKFTIEETTFYSVAPKNSSHTQRVAMDTACIAEFGYEGIKV